ncbi:MAG TPA: acetamidase/formamidase family protein, partial [Thermomicrobiaceae bacterium]|nr:acetamidase/formamidase family protein [Thermomicrobiaceae bacterium]
MRIGTEHVHHSWDNSLAPVQAVTSGGRIDVAMVDASGGQLTSASVAADVPALDFSLVNPVTGPIEIVG